MASRMAPTVAGLISDGVPPPKKMLATRAARREARPMLQLPQEGRAEAGLVDAAAPARGC